MFSYSKSYLLCTILVSALISNIRAEKCAPRWDGSSHVELNGAARLSGDLAKHTFQLWFTPSGTVSGEQNVLQTGVVATAYGSWAVEVKLQTTIWARGENKPSTSVLYVDVWTQTGAEPWNRKRNYAVLGGETFPWAHLTYHAATNKIAINGASRRTEAYISTPSNNQPRTNFALGQGLRGSVDDLRVWVGVDSMESETLRYTTCPVNTDQLELYIPLSECGADMFVGSSYNDAVCAVPVGVVSWVEGSPVAHLGCTVVAGESCVDMRSSESSEGVPAPMHVNIVLHHGIIVLVLLACVVALVRYRRWSAAHVPQVYSNI